MNLSKKKTLRVAGLMSGTSVDGIDAAIVDVGPSGVELLAFKTFPYPPAVRQAVFELFRRESGHVDDICHLNFVLGELFAQAVISLAGRTRPPYDPASRRPAVMAKENSSRLVPENQRL